jgi:hypothetical protein
MLKDTYIKQTSSQEDSLANHSQQQEKEEAQMMTASSGMKLLESSENVNPNGSLGKMLKVLLTSKTAWYSDRCKTIWKEKVSKSGVLLFQLLASVVGIKERGSGLLPTPTCVESEHPQMIPVKRGNTIRRLSKDGISAYSLNLADTMRMYPTPVTQETNEPIEKWIARAKVKKEQGINLQFKLSHHVQMYPTPTVGCEEGGEQSSRVERTKSGSFILRKKNKPESTFGAKLSDTMLYLDKKMYPTPTQRDYKDTTVSKTHQNRNSDSLPITMMKKGKPGGKLNPEFVEFLMGYPMNWTKIEPDE